MTISYPIKLKFGISKKCVLLICDPMYYRGFTIFNCIFCSSNIAYQDPNNSKNSLRNLLGVLKGQCLEDHAIKHWNLKALLPNENDEGDEEKEDKDEKEDEEEDGKSKEKISDKNEMECKTIISLEHLIN